MKLQFVGGSLRYKYIVSVNVRFAISQCAADIWQVIVAGNAFESQPGKSVGRFQHTGNLADQVDRLDSRVGFWRQQGRQLAVEVNVASDHIVGTVKVLVEDFYMAVKVGYLVYYSWFKSSHNRYRNNHYDYSQNHSGYGDIEGRNSGSSVVCLFV